MSKHLCTLVAVFLLSSCAGSPVIGVSSKHGSETEEYAVYDTLIERMYVRDQVEQFVIKDQTSLDSFNEDELDSIFQRVSRKLIALQKTTFNDFQGKAEEDELLYKSADGWAAFYKKYPKSQGIITLSRVGFNPEMNQALVYVGNQSGPKSGAGYYVLLSRENGTWVIKDRYGAWLS